MDILAETRAEMDREAEVSRQEPFMELNSFKKFKAIERVLDAEIRPALHQDGGDVDVEDFQMTGDIPVVTISYKGACLGCMSASVGTLGFIETILKEKLNPAFKVEIG